MYLPRGANHSTPDWPANGTPDDFAKFANEQFTAQSWLERKYISFRLGDGPRPDRYRH